jgi:hypothetical protein
MYQPLQKCLNYNPHFLLLQDILTTVANWLKLRSYICILLNVCVNRGLITQRLKEEMTGRKEDTQQEDTQQEAASPVTCPEIHRC